MEGEEKENSIRGKREDSSQTGKLSIGISLGNLKQKTFHHGTMKNENNRARRRKENQVNRSFLRLRMGCRLQAPKGSAKSGRWAGTENQYEDPCAAWLMGWNRGHT